MERGRVVTGERDQAHVWMVPPEACRGRDAVEKRHVQVEDDRVGIQLLGELDRPETVCRRAHD